MFPPMEREILAQEFLSLKQKTESVTEIMRMFHKRVLFCPEHISTEQARVSRYLIILRTDIQEFVANSMMGFEQSNTPKVFMQP